MTIQNGIYVVMCELCGQIFRPKNMRSFSGTMRRHRKVRHPDHKGSIKYKNAEGLQ